MPISNSRVFQGQLHVTANVDANQYDPEAEIIGIIHEDASGRRSNVTPLIEIFCESLRDVIEELAIKEAMTSEEDLVTLEKQDWV